MVSRLDYCSAIYEGFPMCRLKCLDRVLRTTARLVGPRFGRVSGCMRDVLHWIPYPQRTVYRVAALVRRCMEGLAPSYLREHCCPTVTYYWASYLIALFCAGGVTSQQFTDCYPTAWNGLPVALRLTPVAHSALFLSGLKTTLFEIDRGWTGSAPAE